MFYGSFDLSFSYEQIADNSLCLISWFLTRTMEANTTANIMELDLDIICVLSFSVTA